MTKDTNTVNILIMCTVSYIKFHYVFKRGYFNSFLFKLTISSSKSSFCEGPKGGGELPDGGP